MTLMYAPGLDTIESSGANEPLIQILLPVSRQQMITWLTQLEKLLPFWVKTMSLTTMENKTAFATNLLAKLFISLSQRRGESRNKGELQNEHTLI